MSHAVGNKTPAKDAATMSAACRRLHLPEPQQRTVTLFSANVTGLAVQWPDVVRRALPTSASAPAPHNGEEHPTNPLGCFVCVAESCCTFVS